MEEENITSYLIPGLSLTVIALAFVQHRLTRCSSCKRASIFQRIIFSVLEGKGELHSSAVYFEKVKYLQLLALQATFSPTLISSSTPEVIAGPRFWSWWVCQTAGHCKLLLKRSRTEN